MAKQGLPVQLVYIRFIIITVVNPKRIEKNRILQL